MNLQNDNGDSPLQCAVRLGYEEVAALLVARDGATITQPSSSEPISVEQLYQAPSQSSIQGKRKRKVEFI
ncbi:hypothetical protein SERLA73DRAFT_139293, partial [Serpula lacrymans var. lacrymans S7.3]